MASIHKLPSGRWRAQIRRTMLPAISKTFDKKADAVAWVNDMESDIHHGKFVFDTGAKVEKAFWGYADAKITGNEEKRRSDLVRLNRLIRDANFMVVSCAELNQLHLRAWMDERLEKVSRSSVRREFVLISAAIRYGARHMELPFDLEILNKVERPAEHPPRNRNVSQAEIRGLWDKLPGVVGKTIKSYIPAVFEFCCETALRKGEALALTRGDVHEEDGLMWVRVHMSKNGRGRDVPLSPRAVEIYQMLPVKVGPKLPEETDKEYATRVAQEPLFPIRSGTLDTLFRKAVRELGYDDLHFHDSRHQATLQLSKKLTVMDLAKVTGHLDVRVLTSVYYQPSGADLARALSTPGAAVRPIL
jgi:integrase